MRFRECMVALPRFNTLEKSSTFWHESGGNANVDVNILKVLLGAAPFGAMRSRADSAVVRAWSLSQGYYVSVTLGLRANNSMVAHLQPYGYEAMPLRLRRRNPGVMKPIIPRLCAHNPGVARKRNRCAIA